jgi:hypothetical protein
MPSSFTLQYRDLLLLLLLLLLFITFIQGIYNHITDTNHVSSTYNAMLWLQYTLHVMLFPMLNVVLYFTLVLSAIRVQCPAWLFAAVP